MTVPPKWPHRGWLRSELENPKGGSVSGWPLDWEEWSYLASLIDDDCERQSFGAKGQAAMDALHRIKPPYQYGHPKPFPPGMKKAMRVTP